MGTIPLQIPISFIWIFEFLKNYVIFILIFFNVQNLDSQQDRDSCLKINKYYVIFENSTIRHIPNSFSYVKPGTLMLKMNPSNNINIIIFFLSGFSYFFWIGNMFDEKHQKKGPPKIFSCLYQDSQAKVNVI